MSKRSRKRRRQQRRRRGAAQAREAALQALDQRIAAAKTARDPSALPLIVREIQRLGAQSSLALDALATAKAIRQSELRRAMHARHRDYRAALLDARFVLLVCGLVVSLAGAAIALVQLLRLVLA